MAGYRATVKRFCPDALLATDRTRLIGTPRKVAVTDLADDIATMQLLPETASHPFH
jgi:hypothetical protein